VTLFIALLAAVGTDAGEWVRWTLLGIVAVLAPVWVEIHYLQKARSRKARKKVPLFEMSEGLVAFLAWSASVPETPWTEIGGLTTRWGLVIALATAGALLTASEVGRPRQRAPEGRPDARVRPLGTDPWGLSLNP
jgi:hypothetical protein